MRVVLDSNVLIAAFSTQGLCRLVFELCLMDHEVVLNQEILEEVKAKLHKKLNVPLRETQRIGVFLCKNAQLKPPAFLHKDVCRDPRDLSILGTAVSSGSDVLITGDQDMLVLKEIQGVPILTPRAFWEQYRKGPSSSPSRTKRGAA